MSPINMDVALTVHQEILKEQPAALHKNNNNRPALKIARFRGEAAENYSKAHLVQIMAEVKKSKEFPDYIQTSIQKLSEMTLFGLFQNQQLLEENLHLKRQIDELMKNDQERTQRALARTTSKIKRKRRG